MALIPCNRRRRPTLVGYVQSHLMHRNRTSRSTKGYQASHSESRAGQTMSALPLIVLQKSFCLTDQKCFRAVGVRSNIDVGDHFILR